MASGFVRELVPVWEMGIMASTPLPHTPQPRAAYSKKEGKTQRNMQENGAEEEDVYITSGGTGGLRGTLARNKTLRTK